MKYISSISPNNWHLYRSIVLCLLIPNGGGTNKHNIVGIMALKLASLYIIRLHEIYVSCKWERESHGLATNLIDWRGEKTQFKGIHYPLELNHCKSLRSIINRASGLEQHCLTFLFREQCVQWTVSIKAKKVASIGTAGTKGAYPHQVALKVSNCHIDPVSTS